MISYKIKTWKCTDCGYYQDCEPTVENQNLHFNLDKTFDLVDLQEYECPSCALQDMRNCKLEIVTDLEKMCEHNHLEQSDIDQIITDAILAGPVKMTTGKKLYIPTKDNSNIFEAIDETRLETDQEKQDRINKLKIDLVPADPTKINMMRQLYEYKL